MRRETVTPELPEKYESRKPGLLEELRCSPLVPKVSEALWERGGPLKLCFPLRSATQRITDRNMTGKETEFRGGAAFPKRSANFGNEGKTPTLTTRASGGRAAERRLRASEARRREQRP
jgi:hypothetical protein